MALLASFRRLETIQDHQENISCTSFLWRSGESLNGIADVIPIYFTENQAYKFSGESMYIEMFMISRQLMIRNIKPMFKRKTPEVRMIIKRENGMPRDDEINIVSTFAARSHYLHSFFV